MSASRVGYICVRTLFRIINSTFWLLGCTIVGFAVYLRVSYGGYISLLPQHGILSLDAVLLMLGFLLFTTAFLGCCGAWCKNQCLLVSYFLLVVLLCLSELLGGVLGFIYREELTVSLQHEFQMGIKEYYNSSMEDNGMTLAWDAVQLHLNCCGVVNYEDWYNIYAWPNNSYVPHSCCLPSFKHMADCGTTNQISMWFPSGCFTQVESWFHDRLHFVAVVALAVAAIQLFGLVSSLVLFCAARDRAGYKTYKVRTERSQVLL